MPGELGSASRLSQLLLSNNQLTGALPSFVAYNLALRTVWLDGNQFTGPIPSDWCSANTNNASIINLTVRACSLQGPNSWRFLHPYN